MKRLLRLTLPLAALAACGGPTVQEGEPDSAQADAGIQAPGYTLHCEKLAVVSGSIGSGQGLQGLAQRELSGTQDVWSNYVQFARGTEAVCTFRLPATVSPTTISGMTLKANYRGPAKSRMLWTFDVLEPSTGRWLPVGDNGFASDWRWSFKTWALPDVARVTASGAVQVRFRTTSTVDVAQLDLWSIRATSVSSTCAPVCSGKTCGSADGCGGTCASGSGCTSSCTPACSGKTCGSADGCGGTCASGSGCTASCTPVCSGKTCGSADGCGGTCASGSGCTAPTTGGIWRPQPNTSWQWQLTGTIDTSLNVQMYDVDLFETSQSVIDQLHAQGKKVICYFSAGSQENWRPDASSFPAEVLGKGLDGWAGERWLDVRNPKLQPIMSARMDLAVSKKCDGVEPDNVDGYANDTGFPLTGADQLAYNRFLASAAHARNLSVGLKNDLDQVAQLVGDFDFALNEECFRYNECGMLQPFISANKAVFQVEYGSASKATTICPKAISANFDTLIKNLNLDAWRVSCR